MMRQSAQSTEERPETHDHAWRVVGEVHSRGRTIRLVYRCDLCAVTWTT
jgi:hypothetical protein